MFFLLLFYASMTYNYLPMDFHKRADGLKRCHEKFHFKTQKKEYRCTPTLLTLNLILWKTHCKVRQNEWNFQTFCLIWCSIYNLL